MLQLINIFQYLFIDKLDDKLGLPEVKLTQESVIIGELFSIYHC